MKAFLKLAVAVIVLVAAYSAIHDKISDDSPSPSASKPTREDAADLACEMVAKQSGAEVLTVDKNDEGKAGVMVTMTIKTAKPRRYKARCLFTDNDGSGKIRADIVDTTEQP